MIRIFTLDPLSDVLSLLKPKSAISAGLNAGGEWAIQFPAHEGIKFNAVMRGGCWVSVENEGEPLWIEAGDCFLLTRGRPFRIATNNTLPPIDSTSIFDKAINGIATCNGGGDFFLIGGRFSFEGNHAGMLADALPAIVRVRDASNQAAVLRWALEQLALELEQGSPGGALMADHLAQIMLLQVLRLWLASGQPFGWLGALADQRLTRALTAMHASPERRWTLADLAGLAGMSRTSFAERFRASVGQTPLDYLTGWRMRLAADRLQHTGTSAGDIGYSVGYASEAAFSTAFRRVMGKTPTQYRSMQITQNHKHTGGATERPKNSRRQ